MKKLLIVLIFITPPLFSHGTEYSILNNRVIKLRAAFESGLPFSDSDVLVFPPGISEVEYKLKTDRDGIFYFEPDRIGTWVLQIRGEEGHGLRINLEVNENGLSDSSTGSALSLIQKIIIVLSIGWGAVGTALYFKRGKN